MLDIDLTMGNSSIVKFGGYDQSQIDGDINVFKTNDQDYGLTGSVKWGSFPFSAAASYSRGIYFTPEYPFTYLGVVDFNFLVLKMK